MWNGSIIWWALPGRCLSGDTRWDGWEGVLAGDVPIGAGLSSSAALELVTARAFFEVSDFEWNAANIALTCQAAENKWLGVNCGIMDQMISAAGVEESRSADRLSQPGDNQSAPLPADSAVVILDSGTRRGLVDSAYNERREQCEAAARHFGVSALCAMSTGPLSPKARMGWTN